MCEGVQVGQRGEVKPSPCQGSPLLKMEVVGTAVRCEREDLDWSFFALLLYLSTPTPYRRGHSPPICGWHICFVKDEYSHNYFVYVVIISPEQSRWTLQCSFRTGDGAQVRPSNPFMCDSCTRVFPVPQQPFVSCLVYQPRKGRSKNTLYWKEKKKKFNLDETK